ncbi:uncharacterized protein N7459_001333 [Penicillium hispanicum]|uniref:uncharacterized protein n=1 Tax=Penicillium hispanicum TaxID=1080232 RepID=UPI002540507F|nr:uncharacterized protein N7459_001333 [Penicillium hispanicum]KAJ5595125.1 hypothetical protein N7459_001333 [Penicillium hispanicum]
MKSGRGRRIVRKIIDFLFRSPSARKTNSPPCYNASLCKESAINIGHLDTPPEYSCKRDHESLYTTSRNENHDSPRAPSRKELEYDIVRVWKTVYLGLYEINDNDDSQRRYHYDRIEALYLGAGLPDRNRECDLYVLRRFFFHHHFNNGIAGLQLYDNMSISTLQSILQLLRSYESEILSLQRLYSLLQKRQLDLPALMDLGNGHLASSSITAATKKEYIAIAGPMDKRIRQYDIRMNVLNHAMRDEAVEFDGDQQARWQYVYYKAFPSRW